MESSPRKRDCVAVARQVERGSTDADSGRGAAGGDATAHERLTRRFGDEGDGATVKALRWQRRGPPSSRP